MKQQTLTTTFEEYASSLKEVCELSGYSISDHFADVGKMIALGKGGQRELNDIMINRHDFSAHHSNYATASHNLGSWELTTVSEQQKQARHAFFIQRNTIYEGVGYVA